MVTPAMLLLLLPRSRRSVAPLLIGLVVASITACAPGFSKVTGDVLLPEEFTVNDASCAGAGQASGIREGLAVVITNELESIGAMGALGPGVPAADGCRFPFVIDHVSRGLGRYKVDLDLDDTTGWVAGVALPEDDLFARPLTVSLVRSDRGS